MTATLEQMAEGIKIPAEDADRVTEYFERKAKEQDRRAEYAKRRLARLAELARKVRRN